MEKQIVRSKRALKADPSIDLDGNPLDMDGEWHAANPYRWGDDNMPRHNPQHPEQYWDFEVDARNGEKLSFDFQIAWHEQEANTAEINLQKLQVEIQEREKEQRFLRFVQQNQEHREQALKQESKELSAYVAELKQRRQQALEAEKQQQLEEHPSFADSWVQPQANDEEAELEHSQPLNVAQYEEEKQPDSAEPSHYSYSSDILRLLDEERTELTDWQLRPPQEQEHVEHLTALEFAEQQAQKALNSKALRSFTVKEDIQISVDDLLKKK